MNINLGVLTVLLAFHWIGDFLLQTRWQAENKSKRLLPLILHCCSYCIAICLFGAAVFSFMPHEAWPQLALIFGVISAFLHGCVDFVTSRMTSKAYQEGNMHKFFYIIGLDQFIHFICLSWLYWFTV